MLITLDTNVLYQALYSNLGASHAILMEIRRKQVQIALSVPVFNEYEAVLTRRKSLKDFELTKKDIDKILSFIAYIGEIVDPHYLYRPNLRDESDNMFVELAVASQSDFLITNNIRDFENAELKFDHLKIVTPGHFIRYWRESHG